ncbi:MAG: hypothetical protein AAFP78_06500 [Pseudomonadota bacterium]
MPSGPEPRPSPLPNRMTPWGEEIAASARGGWVGNRGVIHSGHSIVKRSTTRGWVCCALSFKGRKRELMQPGRWTELFFLDEATAFAAGHRPCFECRRKAALAFAEAWSRGQGLAARASAPAMDAVLNAERAHVGRRRNRERWEHMEALPAVDLGDLGAGAMVATLGGDTPEAFLYTGDRLLRWTVAGYADGEPDGPLRLLTPPSALAAFKAGYAPQLHESASQR